MGLPILSQEVFYPLMYLVVFIFKYSEHFTVSLLLSLHQATSDQIIVMNFCLILVMGRKRLCILINKFGINILYKYRVCSLFTSH